MHRYPFAAVVGQDRFKTAYLANIVNPRIGGLLVSGPKGTGKSTIVHSGESILPDYEAVAGCPFNCEPSKPEQLCTLCKERNSREAVVKSMSIISLPLSCTEDRLVGSIDIEKLLKDGTKEVQAGILGEANRNVLYIDEANLLPDHLADDILDAAALHWNTIEREGISISHPSEFVLVGTMNPEEGELRPQILDRFPLCVKVESVRQPELRVEIVKRNLAFEHDPEAFCARFREEERDVTERIHRARQQLTAVGIDEIDLDVVAGSCAELKVDGQRPDIVIIKTAQAVAALRGRSEAQRADIVEAAVLALIHRTRDGGLLEPPEEDEIRSAFASHYEGVRRRNSRRGSRRLFSVTAKPVEELGAPAREGHTPHESTPAPLGGSDDGVVTAESTTEKKSPFHKTTGPP